MWKHVKNQKNEQAILLFCLKYLRLALFVYIIIHY